jgi:hypothetical protein
MLALPFPCPFAGVSGGHGGAPTGKPITTPQLNAKLYENKNSLPLEQQNNPV